MPYLVYLRDQDEYVTGVQPGCVAHAGSRSQAKRFESRNAPDLREATRVLERCEERYTVVYVSPGEE